MSTATAVVPKWTESAVCAQVDPELWFPEKGGSTLAAKRLCSTCPVIAECLDFALTTDARYGIWGGLSVNERMRLERSRPKHPWKP